MIIIAIDHHHQSYNEAINISVSLTSFSVADFDQHPDQQVLYSIINPLILQQIPDPPRGTTG